MKFQPDYQLQILTEEDFDRQMPEILEQLKQCKSEGEFSGFDGKSLHYEYFLAENSRGSVVVVHGLSEFTQKYHEFAYYLLRQGYDVFLYDQRCHGLSCRLTDRTDMIHVDEFADYRKDLECFMEQVVLPAAHKTLYLYAHSMGGAVALQYLAQEPQMFQKAVLSAPMIEPLTGAISPWLARLGMGIWLLFGDAKRKFWYANEFDPAFPFEKSNDESRARFDRNMRVRLSDPRYCTTPLTVGWVYQSLKLRRKLTSRRFLKQIQTPILLLTAQKDGVVSIDAQNQVAQGCSVCRQIVQKDAKHALLTGSLETLTEHMQLVLDHFC